MDALPGRSVHEWMHTTKMPWPRHLGARRPGARRARARHARGVIHGDMKPSNVMLDLASAGRGPRAYILDLGLAWLRSTRHDSRLDGAPRARGRRALGRRHRRLGRPRADPQGRDLRRARPTDLYALGCIMYRVAQRASEVFEGNAQDVLRAHKRTPCRRRRCRTVCPPGAGDVRAAPAREEAVAPVRARRRRAAGVDAARARGRARRSRTIVQIRAPSSRGRAAARRRGAFARARAFSALRARRWSRRDEERRELLERRSRYVARGGSPHRSWSPSSARPASARAASPSGSASEVHERGSMMPLARALRPHPDAARRHHRRGERALRPRGRRPRRVEQTLMTRWEVAPGRRRRAHAGSPRRPSGSARRRPGTRGPMGPTGKRFVLDSPELRFVVIRRILERIAATAPCSSGSTTCTRVAQHVRHARRACGATPPELRLFLVATARSETLETDLDAALRMEAMRAEWNGRGASS